GSLEKQTPVPKQFGSTAFDALRWLARSDWSATNRVNDREFHRGCQRAEAVRREPGAGAKKSQRRWRYVAPRGIGLFSLACPSQGQESPVRWKRAPVAWMTGLVCTGGTACFQSAALAAGIFS